MTFHGRVILRSIFSSRRRLGPRMPAFLADSGQIRWEAQPLAHADANPLAINRCKGRAHRFSQESKLNGFGGIPPISICTSA
jgi:hypothetical protein